MTITFVATLPLTAPTIIGRAAPLASALASRGHRVSLITLGARADHQQTALFPVSLTIAGLTLRADGAERPPRHSILPRLWSGTRALAAAIREQRADVLVLVKAHPQNVFALRSLSLPVIVDADDDERFASRLTVVERQLMGMVERVAARRASAITVCSPALVERYAHDLHARRVVLIPTGLPRERVPAPLIRELLNLPSSARILLYLGSLAISSGHRVDELLAVWDTLAADVPDVHLVIVGDGIDAVLLQKTAAVLRASSRVHFLGRYQPAEAAEFACQADVLLDPIDDTPTSRAKSSSRTLLALLSGVPVIAGDVGIRRLLLPRQLHPWTLVPPGHRDHLLASIRYALTAEAQREFRSATEGRWKQWSWERLGEQFAAVLESVRR